MGIVHLAKARGPGGFEKLVVVKELKPELTDDLVYTAMFLDEARLAARLNHPNIVQTFEVGERGRAATSWRWSYLEGGSLRQRSHRSARLAARAVRAWSARSCRRVLAALHYAHDAGRLRRHARSASSIATSARRTSSSRTTAR